MSESIWRTRHERSERAAQILMEFTPAVAALALWVQHLDATPEIGGTCTDGKRIWYDEQFAAMPLKEQVFVVAHEVLHVALSHPARGRRMARREGSEYSPFLWNVACDGIVNEALVDSSRMTPPDKIVRMAALETEMKKHGFEAKLTLESLDVETLYLLLKKHLPRITLYLIGGEGGDLVLPEQGDMAKEDQEMRDWARRFVRAQQGDKPQGILRKITDLPKVTTPWEHILRTSIMHAVSVKRDECWMRPSRRYLANCKRLKLPYEPGTTALPVPRVAVCVDTSGSIDETLFLRFVSEIGSIMGRTSCHMTVIVCDADVNGVFDLKDNMSKMKSIEFKGGGGTNFIPALEAAAKFAPAICVYLTDLMGTFPEEPPRFPVIWATPPEYENQRAPWGRVVCLKD